MLDANAMAGIVHEIFRIEMTESPTECAYYGNEGEVGELLDFTQGPGITLPCVKCEGVALRIVQSSDAIYLDARGAVYLHLNKNSA